MIARNLIHLVRSHADLAPELRRNLAQLAAANPGWRQIILSDDEALEFVRQHYTPRHLEALARIDPAYGPARSDLLRYLVLYQIGGVYLDNKSGLKRPLDQILRPDDEYLVVQWDNGPGGAEEHFGFHPEIAEVDGGEYINWVLCSRAGHPYLAAVIERVVENIETYSVAKFGLGKLGTLRTTGPIAYTQAIHPILGLHPHRRVLSVPEGFLYTALSEPSSHLFLHKLHYSRLRHPVVLPDPRVTPLGTRMAAHLSRRVLIGLAWLRHRNRHRRKQSRLRRGVVKGR